NPRSVSVTTSGFTWVPSSSYGAFADNLTANHCGSVQFFYISNAAIMTTSVTTVITETVPSSEHCTCSIEFALYEIAGAGSYSSEGNISFQDSGAASNPHCSSTNGSSVI